MPYDYYSLPFCKPSKIGLQKENLGQVVSGDRVENSVYKVRIIFYFSFHDPMENIYGMRLIWNDP